MAARKGRWIGMYPYPGQSRWETHGNPHLKRLVTAIESAGYTVVPVTTYELLNPKRLKYKSLDVLHLHWPGAIVDHFAYWQLGWGGHAGRLGERINRVIARAVRWVVRSGGAGLMRSGASWRIARWADLLERVGIPVVWQVHDLGSHHYTGDRYAEPLDRAVHDRIYRMAKALVIHENSCSAAIEKRYGRCRRVGVARLGSYRDVYGAPLPRKGIRAKFGIPSGDRVLAYIGSARPNRNPVRVATAFDAIDSGGAWLIVAGMGVGDYVRNVEGKIIVLDGYVEPDAIRDIVCAADFVINDGERYLTSAVVRTAISYGVPVIARRYGTAIDMADGAAIWISETADGVARALEQALSLGREDWNALHTAAILRDEERRWADAAEVCDELYKSILHSDAGAANDDD